MNPTSIYNPLGMTSPLNPLNPLSPLNSSNSNTTHYTYIPPIQAAAPAVPPPSPFQHPNIYLAASIDLLIIVILGFIAGRILMGNPIIPTKNNPPGP